MFGRYRLQFSLLIILALVFFATGTLADGSDVTFGKNDWRNAYAAEMISMVNQERDDSNAGQLQENALLQKAAQMKAEDMASRGYFSHDTPDGKDPWYWLQKNGIAYAAAGENLAIKFADPTDVVPAWMASPKHKKNMLNNAYTQTGIGLAKGQYEGREVIFVVELYLKPTNQNAWAGWVQKYF